MTPRRWGVVQVAANVYCESDGRIPLAILCQSARQAERMATFLTELEHENRAEPKWPDPAQLELLEPMGT